MSITNFQPKEFFTGTGSVSVYTFNFRITSKSQLKIIVVDTTVDPSVEVQNIDGNDTSYLSSVVFTDNGGTVTLLANLPAGHVMSILQANDVPLQSFEFRNKSTFSLKRIEDALDYVIMTIQRLVFRANQSIRIHDTDDESTFDTQLPPRVVDHADCIIAVKDDGTGITYGPTVTEILGWKGDAEAAAVAAAASALAAASSETNAAASETAANLSAVGASANATAAAASAAAALTSETNSAASEAAAMAAQIAAENAANSTIWSRVVFLTTANSPRVITDTDKGTLFVVDTSSGNFNFILDQISTLTTSAPWSIGVKKSDPSGNIINIAPSGTDTIDGGTLLTISVPSAGVNLVPDPTVNPDQWTSVLFGAGGGSAAPDLVGTLGVPAIVAPASGILFTGTYYNNIKFLESNGGAIVLTANPQIQPGTLVGQELLLKFIGNVNTIELNDGTGLDLSGKFISEDGRQLCLWWNGSTWSEKFRR